MWARMAPVLGQLLSDGGLIPLACVSIALGLVLLSLRRRHRELARQAERGSVPRGPLPGVDERQLGRDLEQLVVELQELSRQISAQIDTRFAKLEAAMRDADHRIAVLSRLTGQGNPPPGHLPSEAAGEDDRHAVVYELADAGKSPVEIARELGRGPGEVELILKLRKSAH